MRFSDFTPIKSDSSVDLPQGSAFSNGSQVKKVAQYIPETDAYENSVQEQPRSRPMGLPGEDRANSDRTLDEQIGADRPIGLIDGAALPSIISGRLREALRARGMQAKDFMRIMDDKGRLLGCVDRFIVDLLNDPGPQDAGIEEV